MGIVDYHESQNGRDAGPSGSAHSDDAEKMMHRNDCRSRRGSQEAHRYGVDIDTTS